MTYSEIVERTVMFSGEVFDELLLKAIRAGIDHHITWFTRFEDPDRVCMDYATTPQMRRLVTCYKDRAIYGT